MLQIGLIFVTNALWGIYHNFKSGFWEIFSFSQYMGLFLGGHFCVIGTKFLVSGCKYGELTKINNIYQPLSVTESFQKLL